MRKTTLAYNNIRKLFATIMLIVLCVLMLGCNYTDSEENTEKELPEITGIIVINKSYDYDGSAHGIALIGTLSTDKIYYSTNGIDWQEDEILKTEAGEYTIYYKIVRPGYSDYIGAEKLTIKRTDISGVDVKDAVCVFGKQIVPNISGLLSGDTVEYSVNGGEYVEQIEASSVGVYTVSYKIVRPNVGTSEGTFKLMILPNIGGTYIGNGERIILTDTTLILRGEEYNIAYGTDGNGQANVAGSALKFSVNENVLTINVKEYTKLTEASQLLELRINRTIYYAAAEETASVEITFIDNSATFKVNGVHIVTIDGYNYCESVIGCEEIVRNYLTGSVEFALSSNFVDITLTLLNDEAVEPFEDSIVLYDGAPHAIEIEYENVLYLNDNQYEQQPKEYTEVGEYGYTVVIFRDGYLPCVVQAKLIILPDVSGVYVADGTGIIEIDGLTAKINNNSVAFTHGYNSGLIDGWQVEYGIGTITIDGTLYEKADEKIIAFVVGDMIKVFSRDTDFELQICEDEGKTTVCIICDSTEGDSFTCKIEGSIPAVKFDGEELFALIDGDDKIYCLAQSDMGNAPVAWCVVVVE